MNILFLLRIKNDVSYIYDDNTLRQGLEKMKRHGYTAIPVITRDGDYVGTISEGDFLWHILKFGRGSLKDQEQYCVRDIIRNDYMRPVKVSATAEELIESATNQNFVPVVDDRNKFIGIVTRRDIIKYFVEKNK
ncbi:MAG: CBS domain-containing protein [Ruminococcus sp.]|nr:CBS domain-containing protein [Ruminococcus sp.]